MIRPLDLQTLYMQMDKVGKEHSLSREHALHQQELEAQKLAKVHDQQGHAVSQVEDSNETAGEESSKVKADEKENLPQGRGRNRRRQGEKPGEPESDSSKKNEWKDPDMGRHVDLSG